MKPKHSIFLFAFLAISLFSCQKETITTTPVSSEGLITYESGPIVVDRGANSVTLNWSSTALTDVRFEIIDAVTNIPVYGYVWIYFNSVSGHVANFTVTTGRSVIVRIKARQNSGVAANVTYNFTGTCASSGSSGGLSAAPGWVAWGSNPGNSYTTGTCP